MNRHNILALTYSEYTESFSRGKLLAGELYRQWFKKGALSRDTPSLLQAKALVESIYQETNWDLPAKTAVCSENETYKFLLKLHDGYEVESVRIPMKTQETLCVSSQVGCRMGCKFCETGRMGLLRNLTADEIVAQVFVARFLCHFAIRNVVFMGMGEPFDNYDEVKQAIRVLTDQNGLAFGMHRITVSTSGKVAEIYRLADDTQIAPNLAVSLNAPNDDLRTRLMPHNRKDNMAAIRQAIAIYTEKTSRQVLVAYVLMKGINDSLSQADELLSFLEGLDVKVNLIPYNSQGISRFQTTDSEVVDAFAARLRHGGMRVLLRKTKGHSIMAACGQLSTKQIQ